jgi:Helix-turn-helix domain
MAPPRTYYHDPLAAVEMDELPSILTPEEVARVLRCTVASLAQDRFRHQGIPYIKLGRRIRYLRADVTKFLDANHHGNGAA